MTNQQNTSPAKTARRYRVLMSEGLSYCVDILAEDEEAAREIAAETEMKGEPDSVSFDVDSVEVIAGDDKSFGPINGCARCGGVIEANYDSESCCAACRPRPEPTVRQASQELYDRLQDYLDVPDRELPAGLVAAMDGMEAAWHKADGTVPERDHERAS